MDTSANDQFTNYFFNNPSAFDFFFDFYYSIIETDFQISREDLLGNIPEVKHHLFLLMVAQICEKLKGKNINENQNQNQNEDNCLSCLYMLINLSQESNVSQDKPIHYCKTQGNIIPLTKEDKPNEPKTKIFKIQKLKKNTLREKKKTVRNSFYRGVSKTGYRWQVLLMNKKRLYLGSYSSEVEAARVYDYNALRLFGNKAKTNFVYTEDEKTQIINTKNFN